MQMVQIVHSEADRTHTLTPFENKFVVKEIISRVLFPTKSRFKRHIVSHLRGQKPQIFEHWQSSYNHPINFMIKAKNLACKCALILRVKSQLDRKKPRF